MMRSFILPALIAMTLTFSTSAAIADDKAVESNASENVKVPAPKDAEETTAAGDTTKKKVTGGADDQYKEPIQDNTESAETTGSDTQKPKS